MLNNSGHVVGAAASLLAVLLLAVLLLPCCSTPDWAWFTGCSGCPCSTMKEARIMTIEKCLLLLQNCRTEKALIHALNEKCLNYEDARSLGECEYMNIRIPCHDGILRIYKNAHKKIVFQKMHHIEMNYSGIPVFFSNDSMF